MWLPLTLAVLAWGSEQLCPTGAGVTLAIPQHLSDPAEVSGGSLPLGSAGRRFCVCPRMHQGLLGLSPRYRSRWLLWNQWKSSSGFCRAMCGAGAGVCPNCPYTLPVCGLGPRRAQGSSSVQGWLFRSCRGWGRLGAWHPRWRGAGPGVEWWSVFHSWAGGGVKARRPVGNTWQGKDRGRVTHRVDASHLRVARGRWAGGDSAEGVPAFMSPGPA